MKKRFNLILASFIAVFLTSCATASFYQVYKTTPTDKLTSKDNYLVYEDENCIVSYNLWSDGGNIGFRFYNKTDNNIYLNLEESFFILNGVAFDYFRNRVVTHSTSSGSTTSRTASSSKSVTGINYSDLIQTNRLQTTRSVGKLTASGYSISYSDEKVVCIPPKTSKIITEYNINETLYRDCDLFKYPTKKQINSKTFSRNNSPIVFSNRITYSLENSDKRVKFENEFYVSEISNYPESELIELKNDEYCGQKSTIKTRYFKNVAPDKFYIKYTKGTDTWKH